MGPELKCSMYKCDAEPVGNISRYPNSSYCHMHLLALLQMNSNRRPKPVITFFETYDPKSFEEKSKSTPEEKIDQVASKFKPSISKSDASTEVFASNTKLSTPNSGKKSNLFFKLVAGILIFIAAGGLLTWNDNLQTRNTAIETLQTRNEFVKSCFVLTEEDQAAKSGPVGSAERNNAVTNFYEEVIDAPCVVWGDGTVLKNLFYGINSSSDNWDSLTKAYLYSLQRWNSIEEISLRCADGWNSPSIGKQGACSSHGGVVSGFNESKNSDLAGFLSSGEEIYPSLYILEEAAR